MPRIAFVETAMPSCFHLVPRVFVAIALTAALALALLDAEPAHAQAGQAEGRSASREAPAAGSTPGRSPAADSAPGRTREDRSTPGASRNERSVQGQTRSNERSAKRERDGDGRSRTP
jgi:hypothetical protein